MTKTPWIAGAALAAAIGVAAFAQAAPDGPHGPPRTRAELQAQVAEHFKKADANGDGYVTKAEFDAAREAMRARFEAHRTEHREKMFAMLDTNRDGQLSRAEFMAARPQHEGMGDPGDDRGGREGGRWHGRHGGMMHGHGGMAMMMMGSRGDEWFDRMDANHDGRVSLAEAVAGPLARFDKADTNHDGTISPEEHEAARAAMRARWREHRGGEDAPRAGPHA